MSTDPPANDIQPDVVDIPEPKKEPGTVPAAHSRSIPSKSLDQFNESPVRVIQSIDIDNKPDPKSLQKSHSTSSLASSHHSHHSSAEVDKTILLNPDINDNVNDNNNNKNSNNNKNDKKRSNDKNHKMYLRLNPGYIEVSEPRSSTVSTSSEIDLYSELNAFRHSVQSQNASRRAYFIGVVYMLLSAIALSGQGVCIKFGKQLGYHPFELLMARGLIQGFITVLIALYKRFKLQIRYDPLSQTDWFYLLLRGVFAFGTAYFSYSGWSLLPLGDAVSLFSTFPIWTIIVCAIFLGEQIRIVHVVSIISGICGVILITEPHFIFHQSSSSSDHGDGDGDDGDGSSGINGWGVFFCLFAAVINGFAFLCLRKLKLIPAIYSVLSYSIFVVIGPMMVGLIWDRSDWKGIGMQNVDDLGLLIGIGICGFFGQFLKTVSCQYIEAGVGSIVRSTDTIFAYTWQMLLFHVDPKALTLCGAFFVILPVILISLEKIRDGRKKKREAEFAIAHRIQ